MPYEQALEKSSEYEDYKAWLHGRYVYEAFGVILYNAFKKHGEKAAEYPKEPVTQQIETREMTQEEFDALPPEEQEKIGMAMWENAMSGVLSGFNENEGKDDG